MVSGKNPHGEVAQIQFVKKYMQRISLINTKHTEDMKFLIN